MCTRPISLRVPHNPYEEHVLGLQGCKVVTVPCGKCPECLSKRQDDLSVRAYRAALQFGSCFFVTFTYKPDCVPFAQTLLDINLDTGEVIHDRLPELVTVPEVLSFLRSDYRNSHCGVYYHHHDIVQFNSDDGFRHLYQVCYTPTLSYRDFALRMKNFRVDYKRKVGDLNFKYICVGEYGSKRSHRPHFHCLFFGLTRFQVDYFCSFWDLGNYFVEQVKFKNDDGSDGLAKVASYVGKYSAKGLFNPSSVKQRLTIPCRISASRSVGLVGLESLISYYRAYDLCKYDINSVPSDKSDLIVSEVSKRLKSFVFNGKSIPLPVSLRRKIFGYKVVDGKTCWSELYYKVVDFTRMCSEKAATDKFSQFVETRTKEGFSLSEACLQFESLRSSSFKNREDRSKSYLAAVYSQSVF